MQALPHASRMNRLLSYVLSTLRSCLRSRPDLIVENLALRQQLSVLIANRPRPHLTPDGTERELGGKASTGVEAGTIMRVETPGGGYGRPEHS